MSDPAASSAESRVFRACDNSDPSLTLKICALLPEIETEVSTLQCAVAAAQGFAASICAVHVGHGRSQAYVSPEEEDIQQLRDIYEGAPEARLARVKAVFDTLSPPRPARRRFNGGMTKATSAPTSSSRRATPIFSSSATPFTATPPTPCTALCSTPAASCSSRRAMRWRSTGPSDATWSLAGSRATRPDRRWRRPCPG